MLNPDFTGVIRKSAQRKSQYRLDYDLAAILEHCTALHCTVLHSTALHCTALHCTVNLSADQLTSSCSAYCEHVDVSGWQQPSDSCNAPGQILYTVYNNAQHSNVQQCTASHFTTQNYIALHRTTLHKTTLPYTILQQSVWLMGGNEVQIFQPSIQCSGGQCTAVHRLRCTGLYFGALQCRTVQCSVQAEVYWTVLSCTAV